MKHQKQPHHENKNPADDQRHLSLLLLHRTPTCATPAPPPAPPSPSSLGGSHAGEAGVASLRFLECLAGSPHMPCLMTGEDKDILSILQRNSEKGFRLLMGKYQEPVYWHSGGSSCRTMTHRTQPRKHSCACSATWGKSRRKILSPHGYTASRPTKLSASWTHARQKPWTWTPAKKT